MLAVLEHRLPGRMRLRVPDRRGDDAFFGELQTLLAAVRAARQVRVNPATASILVTYSGPEGAIMAVLRDRGVDVREAAPTPVVVRRSRPAATPTAMDLAALGLAASGAVQLARGRVLGSASENLWNAFGLYHVTQRPWMPGILVAFGLRQVVRGEILGSAVSLFLYAWSARRLARHQSTEETI